MCTCGSLKANPRHENVNSRSFVRGAKYLCILLNSAKSANWINSSGVSFLDARRPAAKKRRCGPPAWARKPSTSTPYYDRRLRTPGQPEYSAYKRAKRVETRKYLSQTCALFGAQCNNPDMEIRTVIKPNGIYYRRAPFVRVQQICRRAASATTFSIRTQIFSALQRIIFGVHHLPYATLHRDGTMQRAVRLPLCVVNAPFAN